MSYHIKTISGAYLARGISILSKFLLIPVLLRALSPPEYAILVILTGLEGWFLLLDFGLGASLQNYVAEIRARHLEDRIFLKTALVLSCFSFFIGLLLLGSTSLFFSHFLFDRVLSGPTSSSLYLLTGTFFLFGTFGTTASKILIGQEKGFIVYATQALSHSLSLFVLLYISLYGTLSLNITALCLLGFPSLFSFGLALFVFSKTRFTDPIQWNVAKRAKSFFYFSLMAALVTLSDAFIVPRTLKVEEVIEYNLLCKIFGLCSFAYGVFLQSFAPRCSAYIATQDFIKIRTYAKRFFSFGLVGISIFTVLVLAFLGVIEKTLAFSLKKSCICVFGVYLSVRLISDFYATVLQSASVLQPFFYLVPLQAIFSIALQITLSSYLGINGILLALTSSYLLTVFFALPRKINLLQYTHPLTNENRY